jgi:hypothetical protein
MAKLAKRSVCWRWPRIGLFSPPRPEGSERTAPATTAARLARTAWFFGNAYEATGAASGIGHASARLLTEEGAIVVGARNLPVRALRGGCTAASSGQPSCVAMTCGGSCGRGSGGRPPRPGPGGSALTSSPAISGLKVR